MKRLMSLLMTLILVGCQAATATQPVQPRKETPSPVIEPTATIDPTATLPPYPASPTSIAQADGSGAYPAPTETQIPDPQPFRDCSLWKMLAGCSQNAIPLTGRIAYYDTIGKRLVSIDFATGKGWQVLMEVPWLLKWFPDGKRLLASMFTSEPLAGPRAFPNYVFDQDGKVVDQNTDDCFGCKLPEPDVPAKWSRNSGIVRSEKGVEAWTKCDPQAEKWYLMIRPNPHADDNAIQLSTPSAALRCTADQYFRVYAWLPGTSALILYEFTGRTNVDMMGKRMYIVDSKTGIMENMGIGSHLEPWNTILAGDLMITVDPRPFLEEGFPNLVYYNWRSRKRYVPLPGPTFVQQLSVWPLNNQPEWIAFTATKNNQSFPEADKVIPSPGVYLYNLRTGDLQTVANRNGTFQWVKWVNNGSVLLYGAFPDYPVPNGYAELRAYRPADMATWLVGYLPVETLESADGFIAPRYMTYTP